MSKRVARSIKIDSDLWKEVKHQAVEDEITISGWLEGAIKKKLKEKG